MYQFWSTQFSSWLLKDGEVGVGGAKGWHTGPSYVQEHTVVVLGRTKYSFKEMVILGELASSRSVNENADCLWLSFPWALNYGSTTV